MAEEIAVSLEEKYKIACNFPDVFSLSLCSSMKCFQLSFYNLC